MHTKWVVSSWVMWVSECMRAGNLILEGIHLSNYLLRLVSDPPYNNPPFATRCCPRLISGDVRIGALSGMRSHG